MPDAIPPLRPCPEAMRFLQTRRSRPAKTLRAPVPDRAALHEMLEVAARVPDHGKLEPWRFVVLDKPALSRLAGLVPARGHALGIEADKMEKALAQYRDADLAVAVIAVPRPTDKVPRIEQVLSAGAVCYGLTMAALASGWGANWLSGWASHDETFCREGLGLAEGETVAGLIHIGTEGAVPPERPRPDIDAIVTWPDA